MAGKSTSVDIGGRLRHLRMQHNLSQRELAKRTGVTNSTISLIESNASNPSVGALKRILDGIPIGMADAVEEGRVRSGDLVLHAAFGSGFTWGAVLVRAKQGA